MLVRLRKLRVDLLEFGMRLLDLAGLLQLLLPCAFSLLTDQPLALEAIHDEDASDEEKAVEQVGPRSDSGERLRQPHRVGYRSRGVGYDA